MEQSTTDPALECLDRASVRLVGVRPAAEVVSGLGPGSYLHSGPPVALDELAGPMRGALIGALLFEGEAADADAASAIIDSGELRITPCHDACAVGAMAGIVTPSMPGVVVECGELTVYSPLNEGLGRALRFGSFDEATLRRLNWMREVAGPVLDAAVQASEGLDLIELVSEGLRRGDECHNRNVATSALLIARLAPTIVRVCEDEEAAASVLEFAAANRHFALPFSISAAKAITAAAHGHHGSPIVTAMSGNGRRFGIRVSGTGDRWFDAPAPLGNPVLFEGFTKDDATPTMGDSMITETAGWGAFAITAAPAITSFVGGNAEASRRLVEDMRSICAGTSSRMLIPGDDFRGTPIGIDVHRVAQTGIAPVINNGMAHREAGRGQVGAGLTTLPLSPFLAASEYLRNRGEIS